MRVEELPVALALCAALSSVSSQAAEQSGEQGGFVLEEIVVTAQKRTESVQDVPASITVLGGEQLASLSATKLIDYAAYAPGFQVDSGGTPGQTEITLRGINAMGPTAVVGAYIDDAPLGSSSGFARANSFALDLLPYDVERVEILRGPQGTLYGASTMGGLIKYVMRSPELNRFSARAGAEVVTIDGADDNGWGARASVNAPLIEDVAAMRASYFTQHTPGYVDASLTGRTDIDDVQQEGGRVSLLWQLSDQLTVKLAAMLQDIDADSRAQVSLDAATLEPIYGDLTTANRLLTPFEQRLRFYTAAVNWELGWAEVVAASSYADTRTTQLQDATDGFGILIPALTQGAALGGLAPFRLQLELEKFTQEFRLVSPGGGRVEWLIGAFYTDEDSGNRQHISALGDNGAGLTLPAFNPFTGQPLVDVSGSPVLVHPLVSIDLPSTYREYAVFGDVTYEITDRFDVTAGLRWARNEQKFTQASDGVLTYALGVTPFVGGESSESVTTYMLSPRFHVNEDVMIYARVASGYRPGGPNVALPGVPASRDSDTLVNYEIGLKSQSTDRRFLLDLAVFHIDWRDIQLTVAGAAGSSFGINGGKAQSQGVELATSYSPVRGLRLGLNSAYTDATLSEDVPQLAGVSGDQLPNSAEWSGSLTADYSAALFGNWSGRIGAGYRYVGERYSSVQSSPEAIRAPSYDAVDASLELSDDRWTVRLFARNLTGERAILTPNLFRNALGMPVRVDAAVLQPRTLGLSLDFAF